VSKIVNDFSHEYLRFESKTPLTPPDLRFHSICKSVSFFTFNSVRAKTSSYLRLVRVRRSYHFQIASPPSFTLAAFGKTGDGKSELLNAFLEKEVFKAVESDQSCTSITAVEKNLVEGEMRNGIDTPGLNDTRGEDQTHVRQIVEFFWTLDGGVNAFALVFNGQVTKFGQSDQNMIKMIHQGFGHISRFGIMSALYSHAGIRECQRDKGEQTGLFPKRHQSDLRVSRRRGNES
jgi:hypothetical protein